MPTARIAQDLTQSETANMGMELARALAQKEKVEAEKKVANDGFKGRIDGLASRIHELSAAIESGQAFVEMEVDEEVGAPGVIYQYVKGTREKVGERPMSGEDRQQKLGLGERIDSDGADDEHDELGAETPAEAEALRTARLQAEHEERTASLVETARAAVTVTALDGGGFLAAIDDDVEVPLRETGETEEAAREAVLKLFAESLPKFEAPAPSWDDIQAQALTVETEREDDGRFIAEVQEVPGALAYGVTEEEAVTAAKTVAAETKPRRGLQVPKDGPKPKRARKGVQVQDEAGNDLTPAVDAAGAEVPAPAPGAAEDAAIRQEAGDFCLDDCSLAHLHTETRSAF